MMPRPSAIVFSPAPPPISVADADAAVGEVLSPKTFYSVAPPRKDGTMPTVAIVAANDDYPAGYHAGNAGGLDAIDADLASANIKSGVTIFGKAGTLVNTITHDTLGLDFSSNASTNSNNIAYESTGAINAGADYTILTTTINLAQDSIIEACFGVATKELAIVEDYKLLFFIDGVQQSESWALSVTTFYLQYSSAYKACSSGARIVKVDVHNYHATDPLTVYFVGVVFGGAVKLT